MQASAASNPRFLFDFLFILLVVLDFPLPNSASSAAFPLPTNVSVFRRPLETPKETSVQSTGRSLKSILTLSSESEESGELEENAKGKMENLEEQLENSKEQLENPKEQLENSKEQLENTKEQSNPSINQTNPNETPTNHQSNSIDHSNEPLIHSPSFISSTPSDSIESDLEPIIEFSKDAPAAPILGPFCVICGKFGQYVCDRTDQDVCSLECKRKAEEAKEAEEAALSSTDSHTQTPSIPTHSITPHNESEVLRVLPTAPQFIPSKNRWKDGISPLDSRKCPICGKTGHLAQDCHFASGKLVEFVGFSRNEKSGHRIECDSLPEWQRREVS